MSTPRRRVGAGVAGIGVAIGVASVAGYALLVLTGRMLTPAEFGLFVSFWGVLFGIGGSLSIVEQEAARQTATRPGERLPSMHAVAVSAAVLAGLMAAATLLPPVALRLYGDANSRIGLVVVLAAIGFAVQFAVRGTLIGSGAVRQYAGIVVAEAVARLAVLLALAAAFGVNLSTAAIAVASGSYAWLAWLAHARRVAPWMRLDSREWGAVFRRTASLMVAAALTASVITGYPAMVTALTDRAPGNAGGAVFAALTVSRVPLLLVSPLQAVAVPAVVRWRAHAHSSGGSRLRRLLIAGSLLAVALGIIGGAAGWLWGPAVVRLVYGPAYDVASAVVATLVLSAFLLAWVLLMSAALVALAAYRRMTVMWLAAAGTTAVWLAASPMGVVETTAVGALVGPIAAAAFGVFTLWSLTSPASPPASAPSQASMP